MANILSFLGACADVITITGHPDEKYNGNYEKQIGQINFKPWFRKYGTDVTLLYYDQASGGSKSWSLDDREYDGSSDWYNGGWISPPSNGGLPTGMKIWNPGNTLNLVLTRCPGTISSGKSCVRGGLHYTGRCIFY